MKRLFKNAYILKMDDTPLFVGCLGVTDNRISYLGKEEPKEEYDEIIDCNGNLLMPGFKDAHTHNGMTFLRNHFDDSSLHDWLFEHVFPIEAKSKPEDIYWLSKVSILEALSSGITACEDMYLYVDAYVKASEEMGMRNVISIIFNDQTRDEKVIGEYLAKYNAPKESLTRFLISLHAEYTTSMDTFKRVKALLDKYKAPFSIHLSETERETRECVGKYGMTPLGLMNKIGLFDYGGTAYHSIYLNDDDLKIAKEKNINIVTNPSSNMKLASGVCDVHKYKELGLNVAIGTDGTASNNSLDMFKEMFLCSNLQKLINKDPRVGKAYDTLKMATVNGSKAMFNDENDILEVGKLADIIMIDLHAPNMVPHNDIIASLVYSANKGNVKMTMIDGKILYMDGKFPNCNVEEILTKAEELSHKLVFGD